MNSIPPSLQVGFWVIAVVLVALAFGIRLKNKVKADDTIVEGLVSDLRRMNTRLDTVTKQLDQEREERHKETTSLRTELSRVNTELERTKMTLGLVRDQVKRLGSEPIA